MFSWFNPDPATSAWPYCHTMWPSSLTRITRLSRQALRVGARRVGARWRSGTGDQPQAADLLGVVGPTIECGPATDEPSPNRQTTWWCRLTSITRLLNWSAVRISPLALKPPGSAGWCADAAVAAPAVPSQSNATAVPDATSRSGGG